MSDSTSNDSRFQHVSKDHTEPASREQVFQPADWLHMAPQGSSDKVIVNESASATVGRSQTHEINIPIQNYKCPILPPVTVCFSPDEAENLTKQFQLLLNGRDENTLSQDERNKLNKLALANAYLDKYGDALKQQELELSRVLPEPVRGPFLVSQALQDGATFGAFKLVIAQIIEKGAVGDLSLGVASGLAFGKVVAKLAGNINPGVRGVAMLMQTGGITMSINQLDRIGHDYIIALANSLPSLQKLCDNPSPVNQRAAQKCVETNLGAPIAETIFTTLGFVAAKKLDSIDTKLDSKVCLEKLKDLRLRSGATGGDKHT